MLRAKCEEDAVPCKQPKRTKDTGSYLHGRAQSDVEDLGFIRSVEMQRSTILNDQNIPGLSDEFLACLGVFHLQCARKDNLCGR